MHPLFLQTEVDATGEFDPLGTLIVLTIGALCAYVAYKSYQRYEAGGGRRWLAGVGIGGLLAVLVVVALLLNLAAAVGLA